MIRGLFTKPGVYLGSGGSRNESVRVEVGGVMRYTYLPEVVMTMIAAAIHLNEASTAAMATVWVASVGVGVSLRSSSNS